MHLILLKKPVIACYFPSWDFQLLDVCAQLTPKNDFWSRTLHQEIISPVRKWKGRAEAWNHVINEIIYSNAQYCKGNRIRIELSFTLECKFCTVVFLYIHELNGGNFCYLYFAIYIFFFLRKRRKGFTLKKESDLRYLVGNVTNIITV